MLSMLAEAIDNNTNSNGSLKSTDLGGIFEMFLVDKNH